MIQQQRSRFILYFLIFILIVFIDRYTKALALQLTHEKVVNTFLSFILTFNRGINWGLFNNIDSSVFILINCAIAVVVIALFFYTFICFKQHESIIPHVLVLAGAVSNYFDRLYYHGVIDFILFSVGDWSWPAFNIADVAIVIGIGLLVLHSYKGR